VTALEAPVLYQRLPAVYREHDAVAGYPLRALLAVIAEQAALVEQDVEQLLDDLFVETAQPRVLPLIGELVGNDLLYDASRTPRAWTAEALFDDLAGADLRPRLTVPVRADIAKTISYRRRKGTLPMLEELARDVSGWPARAVEFYNLLGRTQHVDHPRPGGGWLDLRSPERADRVDRAFDEAAHTVDVRPPTTLEGWHGLDTIGLFLWRLLGYEFVEVPARAADRAWRLHFSPLGNPAPLFSRWRREGDEAGLASELHVPAPIRPARFHADLTGDGVLYGPVETTEASLHVVVNGTPVPRASIACRQLVPWPAARPTGRVVAVDVAAGRLAVGAGFGALTGVDVSYHYGCPGDIGGGPYDRAAWIVRGVPGTLRLEVTDGAADDPATGRFGSVQAALAHWSSAAVGRPDTIVTIRDSRAYALPASVTLHNERRLVIQAADGERPVLRTPAAGDPGFEIKVEVPADEPERGSELTLSGVVVEGHLHVSGDLGRLRLLHSTVVPGRRLRVNGLPQTTDVAVRARGFLGPDPINEQLRVEIAFSITGPLLIAPTAAGLWLLDSVVDGFGGAAVRGPIHSSGEQPACPAVVERTTVLGRLRVRSLTAADTIVAGEAICERVQTGELRGTFTGPGSRTPRRIRCQPDRAVEAAVRERERRPPKPTESELAALRSEIESWLAPSFTSTRYGQPGYAQLRIGCPPEIAAGAEDGSEMGAFSHLKQPQRESNLRLRLGEYLPFGLEPGLIYVT
jgi:hypothetical protein